MATLINRELDLCGLTEPMPILRTHSVMHMLQDGDVLLVTTTDDGTPAHFRSYCELSGNTMLLSMEEDDMYTFLLRKHGRGLN